jgi:putative phosphoesterase
MSTYKTLIIGDAHIPRRAKEIPQPILDTIRGLTEEKPFDYTFFTGDLVKYQEFIDFLSSQTKDEVFEVMGNMDYHAGNRDAPIYQELKIDMGQDNRTELVLGLTHGNQIEDRGNHSQLERLAKKQGYDVLMSGHTHQEEVTLLPSGILLLNPGSVTGAWSFIASKVPAFITMTIDSQDGRLEVTLYQLDKDARQIKSKPYSFKYTDDKLQQVS